MKIYGINIDIVATAYIRANSPEEAMKIAVGLRLSCPTILGRNANGHDGEVEISGMQYDNPNLPDISLSPAMTINGPTTGATPDMVHDEDDPHDYEMLASEAGYELKENCVLNKGFYCVLAGDRDNAPTTYPTANEAWEACCRDNGLVPSESPAIRLAFKTTFEQHKDRDGQPFTVIRRITEANWTDADKAIYDAETLPMYQIEFSDGTRIDAWPEEVEAD